MEYLCNYMGRRQNRARSNIKVSGSNEGWVNQRINEIDIDINALKHLISSKTTLENNQF
jgi:hypothetical protein